MVRQKISNYEQPIVSLVSFSYDDAVRTSGVNPYKTDEYDDGTWVKSVFDGGNGQ